MIFSLEAYLVGEIMMEINSEVKENSLILIKQGVEIEARCMTKARRLGFLTPFLYAVDAVSHTLTIEYVEGSSVDVFLNFGSHGIVEERMNNIASHIGAAIGKLHDGGLIHGGLTTSNMLICKDTNRLVLIDFGLSFTSILPKDKAVDLYVLEGALVSMHSSCGNVMDWILAAYRKYSKKMVFNTKQACPSVTKRLKTYHDWMSCLNNPLHT